MFNDIDESLEACYSLFIKTVDKHAPIKTHRLKNDIQPDWINRDILDKMKQRDKLKKQCRFEEYKILRNEISKGIQEAKQSTYESKIEEGKDDPVHLEKFQRIRS